MSLQQGEADFCRVLNPADAWTSDASEDERVANFSGGTRTSVANQGTCCALTVVACFYGCRKGLEPSTASYMTFRRREVEENGGALEKSDAIPPWPPEYNDAHYEITSGEEPVARHMAKAFANDPTRMGSISRQELLAEVCRLFERPDAHQKLAEAAGWRLRRLFRDERAFWNELAERFPRLREDPTIKKELRKEAGTR